MIISVQKLFCLFTKLKIKKSPLISKKNIFFLCKMCLFKSMGHPIFLCSKISNIYLEILY